MTMEKKKGRKAKVHTTGVFQREFKKSDGTTYKGDIWNIRYAVPDEKRPGKTKMKFESSKSKRKGDAEALLLKRRAETAHLIDPERVAGIQPTFKEFVVNTYLPAHAEQSAYDSKRQVCDQLIKYFSDYKLRDITPLMLLKYQEKKTKEASSTTANRHITIFKHIMSKAAEPAYKYVANVQLADLKTIKKKREAAGRIDYLTTSEARQLIELLEPHGDLRQIASACIAGCGREEFCS